MATNSQLPPILAPGRRGLLARLVVNGVLQAATMWGTAKLTQIAVASMGGAAASGLGHWLSLAAGLLAAAIVLLGLRALERRDGERMGQRYTAELRMVLFDHLSRVSSRELQRRRQGSMLLRFVGDLKAMRQWVSLGLARVIVAGLSIVGVTLALFLTSPRLALASCATLMVCSLTAWFLAARTREAMHESRYRQSMLAANVSEKVTSMGVLQLFGQLRRERARIVRQARRLEVAATRQAQLAAILRALGDTAALLASGAVLLTGGWLAATGSLDTGSVIAAMVLAGLQAPALRDLGLAFGYRASADVSREKYAQFLSRHRKLDDVPNAPALVGNRGCLELRDVTLGKVFSNVSAVFEPGKVHLIQGANGCGKSTLLALAARLVHPDSGEVLLDGQALGAHRLDTVHRCVGMAGPDLPLLRGTLDANLRYRWRRAPAAELARVRALCGIDELAATLPEGLQTRLDEGGRNLSPGQRQRVMLARAMLGDPPLLLLDEIDANLDPQAERILDRVLSTYPGTILMVSHRHRRLAMPHTVWRIENNQIDAVSVDTIETYNERRLELLTRAG